MDDRSFPASVVAIAENGERESHCIEVSFQVERDRKFCCHIFAPQEY